MRNPVRTWDTLACRALALAAIAAGGVFAQYPDTLWVPVTYYDYHADGSNPDFEPPFADPLTGHFSTGMVQDTLSTDRKPLLLGDSVFNDHLEEWYRPSGIFGTGAAFTIDPATGAGTWSELVPYLGRTDEWVGQNYSGSYSMACVVICDSLPFHLTDIRTGMYRYDDDPFLPLDGRGFGAEPTYYAPYDWWNTDDNNFGFTMELHRDFVYRNGLTFEFTGDDDVWAFVDGQLVMDLGGVHAPMSHSVELTSISLQTGTVYEFDFFFAERHVSHSQMTLSANFLLGPYTSIGLVPVPSPSHQTRPELHWHPGEYSVTYTLEVATDPSFQDLLLTEDVRDTMLAVPFDLPSGDIYWRVKADNSEFSAPGSFVVLGPQVPIVVVVVPDPTTNRTPVVSWFRPPSMPAEFVVVFDTVGSFLAPFATMTTSDTAAVVPSPLPFDRVYWRVGPAGTGQWSTPDDFLVVPDTLPRLVRYDGDTLADTRPLLAWHPVPGAGSYTVQVANNTRFHSPQTVDTSDTSAFVPQDLVSTMYYWRVSSDLDPSLYSALDSFVVDAQVGRRVAAAAVPRKFSAQLRGNRLVVHVAEHPAVSLQVSVYSADGRTVGEDVVTAGTSVVVPVAPSSGVYLVTVRGGEMSLTRRVCAVRH